MKLIVNSFLIFRLTNDKKQSEASVLSLREELKALKRYGTDNAKQLSVEKRKACELVSISMIHWLNG